MYYLLICNDSIEANLAPYTIIREINNGFIYPKDDFQILWYSELSDIGRPNSDLSSDFTGYVNRCKLTAVPFDSFEAAKNACQTHPEYFI